jgi:dolichol-phosphate mannosyltransferase
MTSKLSQGPAVDETPDLKSYPQVSVIVPMYNEAENVARTVERLTEACMVLGVPFEIIPVNDGSTDATDRALKEIKSRDPRIQPVSYSPNQGRGFAIREGFLHARGEFICTTDADLSYAPEYVPAMVAMLREKPQVDFIVGSPYTQGGGTDGVPWFRLWVSQMGNRVLSFAMAGGIKTVTGVLRAYRREVLETISLQSDGKELHPEILTKAQAAGFRGMEMPAVLTRREKGKSKFRFRATAWSHLLISWHERPVLLFGVVGLLVMSAGLFLGAYLGWQWMNGTLNPSRPLMTLFPMLLVAGLQIMLFGFLGSQLSQLRREIFRMKRQQGSLGPRSRRAGDPQ